MKFTEDELSRILNEVKLHQNLENDFREWGIVRNKNLKKVSSLNFFINSINLISFFNEEELKDSKNYNKFKNPKKFQRKMILIFLLDQQVHS